MARVHTVRHLKWVRELPAASPPPFPKPRRLKGSKAAGIAYERKFGRALPGLACGTPFEKFKLHSGIWLEFADGRKEGWAQPDFFLLPPEDSNPLHPDFGLILETKLSINARGWQQLEKLYLPLLRHLYKIDFKLILVCKNLRPGFSEYPILDSVEPLARDLPDKSIWQWLGR